MKLTQYLDVVKSNSSVQGMEIGSHVTLTSEYSQLTPWEIDEENSFLALHIRSRGLSQMLN